jgi:hypothetical protein
MFFDSITENLHIVYSSSKYCNNSSNGSGGTAIVIRKPKGLKIKNFEIKKIHMDNHLPFSNFEILFTKNSGIHI